MAAPKESKSERCLLLVAHGRAFLLRTAITDDAALETGFFQKLFKKEKKEKKVTPMVSLASLVRGTSHRYGRHVRSTPALVSIRFVAGQALHAHWRGRRLGAWSAAAIDDHHLR